MVTGITVTAMTEPHRHESHPDILNRLKRAQGHLGKIISMIEQERGCLDVAQQMQAVESAITNAKRRLIQDHIDHCLLHVANGHEQDQRSALEEFKQIAKYL
jgi:DNA-binding FrmR family transcriptional regulator